ncbi:NAD kinase isoform X2 [Drosophila grimshawi]|uniref:NAD kinase isoform X2 n=1 Tax=Drosophila grimshawi TaxID=7222 RepID=UPI000C8703A2|nr:NAD kinase isoform X2 [Drosophila grimshawi]
MSSPHDITKATSAQSVPGASAAEATSGPSYHGSYFDEQENHLLNVNNARQKLASNGSASSAPGPGILTNGTASDIEMRWWWRTRSLNAPSPVQQFGPCGRIMKNSAMVMQIQDPASQRLTWYKPPLTVLVIKKKDSQVLLPFVQLVEWLVQEKNMVVWVESAVLEDKLLRDDVKLDHESPKFRQVHEYYSGVRSRFLGLREKLVTFKDGRDDLTDRIDFIVCLGGDGTLLYASQLFQQSVPPVMAFYLGSLGFLTPFQCDNFQEQVTNVLEGHAALTLRSRLRCSIHRKAERRKESLQQASSNVIKPSVQRQYSNVGFTDSTACNNNCSNAALQPSGQNSILVLNEVVINRGPSPYLSNIDIFLDGKYITSVQGDGLIVSTPTGSTAYAAAAGASMIHPSVPAILVTPICPHSLSFRPIVVPAGVELKISISPDSRNTSRVSFDGRNDQELNHGDSLRVTTSIYPVPSICAQDQISDWFDSLAEGLHWNVRKRQKCLDELSDLTASGSEDTLDEFDNLKMFDS